MIPLGIDEGRMYYNHGNTYYGDIERSFNIEQLEDIKGLEESLIDGYRAEELERMRCLQVCIKDFILLLSKMDSKNLEINLSSTDEVENSLSISISVQQHESSIGNESIITEPQKLNSSGITDSFYELDVHNQTYCTEDFPRRPFKTDRNPNKTPDKLRGLDLQNISVSKSSLKIGADLYERGLKIMDHKKAFPDEFIKANYSFKPTISSNSEKLIKESKFNRKPLYDLKKKQEITDKNSSAKKLQGKELEDFIKRNYKTQLENYKVKKQRPSPERNVPDSECTFKPKLNPASLEMVPNRGLFDDIYYRGLKSKEIKKQKDRNT